MSASYADSDSTCRDDGREDESTRRAGRNAEEPYWVEVWTAQRFAIDGSIRPCAPDDFEPIRQARNEQRRAHVDADDERLEVDGWAVGELETWEFGSNDYAISPIPKLDFRWLANRPKIQRLGNLALI